MTTARELQLLSEAKETFVGKDSIVGVGMRRQKGSEIVFLVNKLSADSRHKIIQWGKRKRCVIAICKAGPIRT